jgi:transcriptional regulator with XRE-family HTH domain
MPHTPTAQSIGKRLRQAREDREIGKPRAADEFGISVDTLERYEAGKTEPSYRTLVRAANLYGRTVNWFAETNDEVTA